jgi:hypothetical protein
VGGLEEKTDIHLDEVNGEIASFGEARAIVRQKMKGCFEELF